MTAMQIQVGINILTQSDFLLIQWKNEWENNHLSAILIPGKNMVSTMNTNNDCVVPCKELNFSYKPSTRHQTMDMVRWVVCFALLSIIFDAVSGIFILYVCFEFSNDKGTLNSKIVQGLSRQGANDWLWLWLWLVTAAMNMNISPSIKEDKKDNNNNTSNGKNENDKSNENGSKGFSLLGTSGTGASSGSNSSEDSISSDNEGSKKLLVYSFRDPDSLPLLAEMNSVE